MTEAGGRATRFSHWLAALVARRSVRLALSAISGVGLALSFPPYNVFLAIMAYSALLVLLDVGERAATRPWLERLLLGAAFGFGMHLMGLWWEI